MDLDENASVVMRLLKYVGKKIGFGYQISFIVSMDIFRLWILTSVFNNELPLNLGSFAQAFEVG
jgi:hypothetical protein